MTLRQGPGAGGTNASWYANDVRAELPTISGSSVGLPANTIYVDPATNRMYRTT